MLDRSKLILQSSPSMLCLYWLTLALQSQTGQLLVAPLAVILFLVIIGVAITLGVEGHVCHLLHFEVAICQTGRVVCSLAGCFLLKYY